MVNQCAVFGCNNCARGCGKKLSYYRFSYPNTINVETLELAKKRRKLWYLFLKRKDFDFTDANLRNKRRHRVIPKLTKRLCANTVGKPADLKDTSHVDWIPTLKPPRPTKKINDNKIVQRYQRWKSRTQDDEADTLHEIEVDIDANISAGTTSVQVELENIPSENLKQLKKEIEKQLNVITDLKKENELLQIEKNKLLLKEEAFVNEDNEKIEFYTGLPNLEMFHVVMNTIQEHLCNIRVENLNNFQKLLMTLMKLRLNSTYEELAYRFQIDQKAACRVFQKVIIVLKHSLQNLIHWPDNECLKISTPQSFRSRFGTSVVAIIDCFKICTQRPSIMKARNQSWSDYKQKYAAKYLIAVTPYGAISFISDGHAGQSTDTFITDQCGILNKLIPGDVVLTDRGYLVKNSVALKQVELNIPVFKKEKPQLHPTEVEDSKEIAAVRIHVERVIGCIRQKYQLLNGPVPISLLKTTFKGNTLLDYAVHVACIMTNLCESVVSDS